MFEKKSPETCTLAVFAMELLRNYEICTGISGDFFSSNFRDIGKAMPVVFEERKMSFWVREKASYDFREGNSGP